ncbi:MAG TPA: SGNH/GDSL hydrolase family protein [Jiangellales bacterium]|nr:SGNH/GDSL hydrolase family protein [Jiangellales bacterium]
MRGRTLALAALVSVATACSAERAAAPGPGTPSSPAPPPSESPTYLALGDSLAAGVGAPAGEGYVDLVHAGLREELPDVDLLSFGVSGETTSSMLTPGGQLERAEEALRSGEVRLVTIDIGANDGLGCALARDEACVEGTLDAVRANLATVLERIRTADPDVPVVGTDYYLPVPPQLQDDPSQVAAALDVLQHLNDTLADVYAEYDVPVAPVSDAFGGLDPALVVERTCAYTSMCSPAPDIHPNPSGHAAIAGALLAVLPDVG